MFTYLLKKLFGTKHERAIKRMLPIIARINEFDEQYQGLSDAQLQAKTEEFRERYRQGESLDELLPEAFATVKNACRRLLGTRVEVTGQEWEWDMVPYDVQLIGGIALHRGSIAEMQTGEGKTLVAIMPLYLNALSGRNCQLVTVTDYLARRDAAWVGAVLQFLGMTVGCIQNDMKSAERREQYACDVTYGTNSEFGFDYLRDMGMANHLEDMVQRDHYFVIIDEVDSILIDEARTPLIISGPVAVSTHQYDKLRPDVHRLVARQNKLCNDLVRDAKLVLDQGEQASDADYRQAILKLLKAQMGMPTHKQLLRLLEEPQVRRDLERMDSEVHSDNNRGMLQEVKEELYFSIDERAHDADLSEMGRRFLRPDDPDYFVIPDLASQFADLDNDDSLSPEQRHAKKENLQQHFDQKSEIIQNISQLLRAYCLFEKDRHYILEEGRVIIVDEHTGVRMPGRRYSEGLHQALEAKEDVKIERETQTLATITIQNYFRLYDKLAGMTGTAETEAGEFGEIYSMEVLVIPTNRPCVRKDYNDLVFKTLREKFKAVIEEVRECHERGQPVLLGTASVETSEVLSRMLQRAHIPHNVLNAKQHQREAEIVRHAGEWGMVTVATNMAGRGTDIRLGEGVREVGGLHVIGSERHDSRRIDRQLRGRCARQGDPGSSRFYVSFEDPLMRLFGGDRITKIMEKFKMEEGEQLSAGVLDWTIENAQRRVEQQNFSIRKRTLQYDDVMNKHREVIYARRHEILTTEDPRGLLFDYIREAVEEQVASVEWDLQEFGTPFDKDALFGWLRHAFPPGTVSWDDLDAVEPYRAEALVERLMGCIERAYQIKEQGEEPGALRELERQIMLGAIDRLWRDHLYQMDDLRQNVYLHGHAQRDPLVEFKREAYSLFGNLLGRVSSEVALSTFRSATTIDAFRRMIASLPQATVHQQLDQFEVSDGMRSDGGRARQQALAAGEGEGEGGGAGGEPVARMAPKAQTFRRDQPKVGRNDPCPCGSGKKFKKCCGAPSKVSADSE